MLASVLIIFLSVLAFYFFFWQKLKEDYIADKIFSTASIAVFAIFIYVAITNYYFPNWWIWGAFLGAFTGLFIGVKRQKLRYFEAVNAFVPAILPWLFGANILFYIRTNAVQYLFAAGLSVLMLFLYIILERNYKRFSWYPSGRVGFSGLVVIFIFFTIRGIVAFLLPDMLPSTGVYDSILSGVVALASIISVIILARE
jgi:hypothetical protein